MLIKPEEIESIEIKFKSSNPTSKVRRNTSQNYTWTLFNAFFFFLLIVWDPSSRWFFVKNFDGIYLLDFGIISSPYTVMIITCLMIAFGVRLSIRRFRRYLGG